MHISESGIAALMPCVDLSKFAFKHGAKFEINFGYASPFETLLEKGCDILAQSDFGKQA